MLYNSIQPGALACESEMYGKRSWILPFYWSLDFYNLYRIR